jgi:transcription elongation factor GreA
VKEVIMKKQFALTKEGVKELEDELKILIAERGPVAERIKTAREFGDLAENAEYQSARQEQEKLETRISDIENILKSAEIIKKPNGSKKVNLGSTVTLSAGNAQKVFTVVGTVEANPLEGKISDESPIGRVLIGKKLGDQVEIATPSETASYKIAKIG